MSVNTIKTGARIGSVIISGILLTLEVLDLFNGKKPEPEAS